MISLVKDENDMQNIFTIQLGVGKQIYSLLDPKNDFDSNTIFVVLDEDCHFDDVFFRLNHLS